MEYKQVKFKKGDLFQSNDDALAHCVSRDFAMGAGIAKMFKAKFNRVSELKSQNAKVGGVAYIDTWNRRKASPQTIFYMVTKERYYEKPTMRSVRSSLLKVREIMVDMGLKSLSMPMIAAGLDRLLWADVLREIEDIFNYSGIKVTIWVLK